MCVGLPLMFRPLLFVLRMSTISGQLVHSFSKWLQSINSFLHVVEFLCQVFDGVNECNTLFGKGTGGTLFIHHILTPRAGCGFFNLQGLTFFSLETLQCSCSYGCFS